MNISMQSRDRRLGQSRRQMSSHSPRPDGRGKEGLLRQSREQAFLTLVRSAHRDGPGQAMRTLGSAYEQRFHKIRPVNFKA